MQKFLEGHQIESAILPVDTTGAAQSGDWMSLAKFGEIAVEIVQGAWAGGTSAVTLEQATDVSGTGAKALSFAEVFQKIAVTGTVWSKNAVASDTFDLDTANEISVIQVSAEALDTTNDFDCIRVKTASPGANATLLSANYILGKARYPSDATETSNPKVD